MTGRIIKRVEGWAMIAWNALTRIQSDNVDEDVNFNDTSLSLLSSPYVHAYAEPIASGLISYACMGALICANTRHKDYTVEITMPARNCGNSITIVDISVCPAQCRCRSGLSYHRHLLHVSARTILSFVVVVAVAVLSIEKWLTHIFIFDVILHRSDTRKNRHAFDAGH